MKENKVDHRKKAHETKMPMRRIRAAEYHTALTPRDIDSAVAAFVNLHNLEGGSAGDVDLYRLLRKYLLNLEARREINAVIHHAL